MSKREYATCRVCGRHRREVGLLSRSRLCAECGPELLAENIIGLREHRGEPLARWRRGMAASIGGVLLDDLEAALDAAQPDA